MEAANADNSQVVSLLIEAGADMDMADDVSPEKSAKFFFIEAHNLVFSRLVFSGWSYRSDVRVHCRQYRSCFCSDQSRRRLPHRRSGRRTSFFLRTSVPKTLFGLQDGKTALDMAVENKQWGVAEAMSDLGVKSGTARSTKDEEGGDSDDEEDEEEEVR